MERTEDGAPLLVARGLGKSFGAVRVLHDLSFEVRQGEVLGILGPNGAGKTTLFNLISGDIRDHAGAMNSRVGHWPAHRSAAVTPGSAAPTRSRSPMPG